MTHIMLFMHADHRLKDIIAILVLLVSMNTEKPY